MSRLVWVLFAALVLTVPARAEVSELRVSRGFGIHYLPLFVMEQHKLVEKHAAAGGLGAIKTAWSAIDGGNQINDAMISGSLDIATLGVPGFLVLWDKARGNARLEVSGIGGVSVGSMYVNSRLSAHKSLRDFSEKDKIAVPGIKTSYAAVVLQMLVAKEFGDANYAKLDPLTVGIPYPEGVAALISGKTEITAHVASPPFNTIVLDHPGIHRVVNSSDVLGPLPVIMAMATKRFHDANPKMVAAFRGALDEACRWVEQDKPAAARLYVAAANVKTSEDLVRRILEDPDNKFSITPVGTMTFAAFMNRVGTLKNKPADWKDLFFADVHQLPGS